MIMKTKTATKLGVGTLAVVAISSLVGSISGTIAWFQYTTRVTANYTGVVSHVSESLEISLDGKNWKTDLDPSDIRAHLLDNGRNDTALRPVTSGVKAKDGKLGNLYKNPIYQYDRMSSWGVASEASDYLSLPFQIRVKDVNGAATERFLDKKNIYLSELSIANHADNAKFDISDALRVHVTDGANVNRTFSKNGSAAKAFGELDLNGDYQNDRHPGFGTNNPDVIYGAPHFDTMPGALNLGNYITYNVGATQKWDEDSQEFVTDVAAHKDYYVWNGSIWEKYTGAGVPSGGAPLSNGFVREYTEYAVVSSEAELKDALALSLHEGDVIEFGGAYKHLVRSFDAEKKGYKLVWEDLGVNGLAESYAADDISVIADDNNPYDIKGTPIGTTFGKAASLDELLKDDVYALVDSEDDYYHYKDGAWTNVGDLPAGKTSIDTYESAAVLPINNIGDLVYIGSLPYEWKSSFLWGVKADFFLDSAADLPAPNEAVPGKTYYIAGATNLQTSNGIAWSEAEETNLTLNVTIYLEGWQELQNNGTIAVANLPKAGDDGVYLNGAIIKVGSKNYTWTGGEFEEGKKKFEAGKGWVIDSSLPDGAEKASIPDSKVYVGMTYEVLDGVNAGHLLHWNGQAWVNGGATIWDAVNYVGSQFSIGLRFSTDAHADHN